MSNQPDAAALHNMSPADLLAYKTEMEATFDREVAALKTSCGLDTIDQVIQDRFEPALKLAVDKDLKKKHGTFRVLLDPQHNIWAACNIRQSVVWDQDKLRALASKLSWEEAQHYFDIKLSMKETTYKAIPPGTLKLAIDDARTTTLGPIKVEIEQKAAAA